MESLSVLHQSSTESSLDVSLEFIAGEQIIRFVIVGFRGKEYVHGACWLTGSPGMCTNDG
ncbi:hypothetical protein YC2023_014595 [Brassica napus]